MSGTEVTRATRHSQPPVFDLERPKRHPTLDGYRPATANSEGPVALANSGEVFEAHDLSSHAMTRPATYAPRTACVVKRVEGLTDVVVSYAQAWLTRIDDGGANV